MAAGKEYQKGDPVRGAAILMLACEVKGIAGKTAAGLIENILADLGVKEADARRYLARHRDELLAALKSQEEGT
jgi:hypothetical protein